MPSAQVGDSKIVGSKLSLCFVCKDNLEISCVFLGTLGANSNINYRPAHLARILCRMLCRMPADDPAIHSNKVVDEMTRYYRTRRLSSSKSQYPLGTVSLP